MSQSLPLLGVTSPLFAPRVSLAPSAFRPLRMGNTIGRDMANAIGSDTMGESPNALATKGKGRMDPIRWGKRGDFRETTTLPPFLTLPRAYSPPLA